MAPVGPGSVRSRLVPTVSVDTITGIPAVLKGQLLTDEDMSCRIDASPAGLSIRNTNGTPFASLSWGGLRSSADGTTFETPGLVYLDFLHLVVSPLSHQTQPWIALLRKMGRLDSGEGGPPS